MTNEKKIILKYKVGDTVKVKTWESIEKDNPRKSERGSGAILMESPCDGFPHYFTLDKSKFSGTFITIERVHPDGYESNELSWCDDMFEDKIE